MQTRVRSLGSFFRNVAVNHLSPHFSPQRSMLRYRATSMYLHSFIRKHVMNTTVRQVSCSCPSSVPAKVTRSATKSRTRRINIHSIVTSL